jgi:uncharacterized cupredoxin-like copper-binding protein
MRGVVLFLGVLGLLGGCAGSPGSPQGIEEVRVTIEHSRFEPEEMTFPEGQEVRFVIRNTDPIDHEFILGDEEIQQIHEEGTEAHHGAKPGEISIPAGKTRVTTYTFTDQGELIYGCHLPGHYDFGMKGTVTVAG